MWDHFSSLIWCTLYPQLYFNKRIAWFIYHKNNFFNLLHETQMKKTKHWHCAVLRLLEFSLVSGKFHCKNQKNLVLPFSLHLYVIFISISFKQTQFLRLTVQEHQLDRIALATMSQQLIQNLNSWRKTSNSLIRIYCYLLISWFPGILYMGRS